MAATCTSLQSPPPRAVLTPRAVRARAIPRMLVTPLAWISLMMGRTLAANVSAISLRPVREAHRLRRGAGLSSARHRTGVLSLTSLLSAPTKENLLIIRVTIDSGWHFLGLPSARPHPAPKDVGMFYVHADPPKTRFPNGGLIVPASGLVIVHRDLIIMLAARHKLPAVYYYSFFVAAGGLVSYGPDPHDQYRQAAGYVDRILRGEKPADLPVQTPTKYRLVINLKTAKALGLEVPTTVLARADEVIE